jgi:hypothetical protein
MDAEVSMRRIVLLTFVIAAFTLPAGAQFVAPGGTIPAVANIAGPEGSFWRSDVSILNLSTAETTVRLMLLPEIRGGNPVFEPVVTDPYSIPGDGQLTFTNVVTSVFGLRNVKGGLQIFSDGPPVVLASRTYTNADEGGRYGLDVRGVLLVADTAWVANVEHDSAQRTNIGIFMPVAPPPATSIIFTVVVKDNEGVEVGSGSLAFDQAGLKQKSLDFFGVEDLFDGWIEFRSSDPSYPWYAYATVVDNLTNDSVYRAAIGREP